MFKINFLIFKLNACFCFLFVFSFFSYLFQLKLESLEFSFDQARYTSALFFGCISFMIFYLFVIKSVFYRFKKLSTFVNLNFIILFLCYLFISFIFGLGFVTNGYHLATKSFSYFLSYSFIPPIITIYIFPILYLFSIKQREKFYSQLNLFFINFGFFGIMK